MMQANELRIGNLVFDKENNVREICGIQYPYTHLTSLRNPVLAQSAQFNEIEPIKLTEEILLKCGAKKDGWEFKLKACALEITIRLNAGYVYCEFGNVYLGDRITYLHELQNLVYGLSKRELEVKL